MLPLSRALSKHRKKEEVFQPIWDKSPDALRRKIDPGLHAPSAVSLHSDCGTNPRLFQKYHVATLRKGRHASPRSRSAAALGISGRP